MNKNSMNNDINVTIAPVSPVIRSNFSFLGETRMVRMWTIMNEGFHVVLLFYFLILILTGIAVLCCSAIREEQSWS